MLFRRRRPKWAGIDVLTLVPRARVASETDGDGRVVLLVPRFRSRPLSRWLQPRLRPDRAHVRVRLDERGTAIWNALPGAATVADLVAAYHRAYPEDQVQLLPRIWAFLEAMERNRFVSLSLPAEPAGG